VLRLWREADVVPGRTDDREALHTLLDRDPGALLVAESEGRLVGALIAAWDGWRGGMYRLAVHPSQRRRGLARRLVEQGEGRLRAMGARRITALVLAEDEPAVAVWLEAGYERDPRIARFVKSFPGIS
jgi:ribosomal protein S18 acetylase RimI-like enzyme